MERGHLLEPQPVSPARTIPPVGQALGQAEIREGDRLLTLPLPGAESTLRSIGSLQNSEQVFGVGSELSLEFQLAARYPVADLPPRFDLGGEA